MLCCFAGNSQAVFKRCSVVWRHQGLSVAEYQKPPRSKSQRGSSLDDVKELQVRVKLDHPVLEHDHWNRLFRDMKNAERSSVPPVDAQLPSDVGLDQSRMLVIQAAVLCTTFLVHVSDICGGEYLRAFPRHQCEKDMCIDIRSLTNVILTIASQTDRVPSR